MIKIATIIGARPQFIKAAVLSRVLSDRKDANEVLIHTGQHYDQNMSKVFFEELNIPHPKYNLEIGSGKHGEQTGKMLASIENVLLNEKPDWVLVYGDTNSTLAGALAASKLHIPVAHVEAGLRSFNRNMPEEINRISTDHISELLFAPTQNAMQLLKNEGLESRSLLSGDIMYDSVLHYKDIAFEKYGNTQLEFDDFYLATVHRQENTDVKERLQGIFNAFSNLDKKVLLPIHPRTRKLLSEIKYSENVKLIDPVGYIELLYLLSNSAKVLTDSGGLQKEAFFLNKPCITLRDETEWIETLDGGWNYLVGANENNIIEKVNENNPGRKNEAFGNGKAGEFIANKLLA